MASACCSSHSRTGASRPERGRKRASQWGLGRQRASNTKSAIGGTPFLKANDSKSTVSELVLMLSSLRMTRRNWWTLSSLVSMTRSAMEAVGRISLRSRAIASARPRPSSESGWRRRVSEKRLIRISSRVSRNSISYSMPISPSSERTSGRRFRSSIRLRTSTPTASRAWRPSASTETARTNAGSKALGRLSTQEYSRSSSVRRTTDLPEPESPLTTIRRVMGVALVFIGSPWRQPPQLMRLPIDEGLRRIESLRFQHVAAHGGFGEHGDVAARGDRNDDLRYRHIEHLAIADVAVQALHG